MTLVEIMAVLIIIGLVATMVSVAVLPQIQWA
jgi:prepilin-type N-terminal cleavage/methylation domain-containing protein